MAGLLYPICALLAWAAAASVRRRRGSRDRADRVLLIGAFTCLAITFTISTPIVCRAFDRVSPVQDLSTLIAQGCFVSYAAAVLALLTLWTSPPTAQPAFQRRRLAVLAVLTAAVLAAMCGLFLASPRPSAESTTDFVARYAGTPLYETYLALYVAVVILAQVETIRLGVRYIPTTTNPWLRRSLLATTAGATVTLGYTIGRTADVLAARTNGADPYGWESATEACIAAGTFLIVTGLTLPSWGPRLAAIGSWLYRYNAYLRLRPLWHALYTAEPGIAANPPPAGLARFRRHLAVPFRLDYHLGCRVSENRDGCHLFRRYYDPTLGAAAEARHRARGLTGIPLAAAVEAEQLHAALATRRTHATPNLQRLPPLSPDTASWKEELAWQLALCRAFTRTPAPATSAATSPNRTDTSPSTPTSP